MNDLELLKAALETCPNREATRDGNEALARLLAAARDAALEEVAQQLEGYAPADAKRIRAMKQGHARRMLAAEDVRRVLSGWVEDDISTAMRAVAEALGIDLAAAPAAGGAAHHWRITPGGGCHHRCPACNENRTAPAQVAPVAKVRGALLDIRNQVTSSRFDNRWKRAAAYGINLVASRLGVDLDGGSEQRTMCVCGVQRSEHDANGKRIEEMRDGSGVLWDELERCSGFRPVSP